MTTQARTAEAENERFTQWICETQPVCLCIEGPNDGQECVCQREDGKSACSGCEAPMVEIDFETGDRVTEATVR